MDDPFLHPSDQEQAGFYTTTADPAGPFGCDDGLGAAVHDDGMDSDEDVAVTFRTFQGVDPSAPLPPPSDETSPRSILDFDGSGAGVPKKKSPKAAPTAAPPSSLASLPVSFHIPAAVASAAAPLAPAASAEGVPDCSPSRARPLVEVPFSPSRRPGKSVLKAPRPYGSAASTTTTRSPTLVRFGGMVHFRQIKHINDFTQDEIKELWMLPEDFLRVRATIKSTVSVMNKREKRQLQDHMRRQREQRQQQQQQRDSPNSGSSSSRKHPLRRHISMPPIATIREDGSPNDVPSGEMSVSDGPWESDIPQDSSSSSDEDDELAVTLSPVTFVYEFPGDHAIDPDYCPRGLETRTKVGSKRRSFHKLRTRSAVLNEQEMQLDEIDEDDEHDAEADENATHHVLDPQYIAMASMEMSLSCRQGARARGIQDARAIAEYVASARQEIAAWQQQQIQQQQASPDTAAIVAGCLANMA